MSPKKDFAEVKNDIKHDKMSENPLLQIKPTDPSGEKNIYSSPPGDKEVKLDEGNVLQVRLGNFSWDIAGSEAVLHDLNFDIPEGQ